MGEFRVSSDDIGSPVHIEAVVPVASQAAPHRFQLKADTTNAAEDVYFTYQSITATTFPMNAAP